MSRVREVRLMACVSLDGYIADRGGSCASEAAGGWTSEEDKREFWSEVDEADMVVVGRRTAESMPAGRLEGKPVVLLSSRPDDPIVSCMAVDWVVDPYPSEMHDFLEGQRAKRLLVCGGSMTYDFFLRWNLVDHMVIIKEPVSLGGGVRFRTPPKTAGGQNVCRFSLVSSKSLNTRGTLRLDLRRIKTW